MANQNHWAMPVRYHGRQIVKRTYSDYLSFQRAARQRWQQTSDLDLLLVILLLPSLPLEMRVPQATGHLPVAFGPEGIDLEQLERALLNEALRRAEGSRSGAGKLLGLSRHQIRNRLKKFGVEA